MVTLDKIWFAGSGAFTYTTLHAIACGMQSKAAFMGLATVRGKMAGQTALGVMTAQKKSWETCVTEDTSHLSRL